MTGALNYVEFRTNPEPYMVEGVVHDPWRRAACKVHGSHEPHVVRGAPRVIRTPDLRIRSPFHILPPILHKKSLDIIIYLNYNAF